MSLIGHRELEYFGGWQNRSAVSGTHRWGDPFYRNHQVTCTGEATLLLPDDTEWLQPGVTYLVLNNGSETLTVESPDAAFSLNVPAGQAARFVKASVWRGWLSGAFQTGSVEPPIFYDYDIVLSQNEGNFNLLERIIATHGYDGSGPATVRCRVASGVAVGAYSQSSRAFTTGDTVGGVSWAPASSLHLTVDAGGLIGGWGGEGGDPGISGTGLPDGFDGGDGGQGLRLTIPTKIRCLTDAFGRVGYIFGGGGGGGGGGGDLINQAAVGGGGGGGSGVRMGIGSGTIMVTPGGRGGTSGSISFGGGGGHGYGGAGNGGNGGGRGANGSAGSAAGGINGGLGGAAGAGAAAISYLPAAGAPDIVTGGAGIGGAIVAEAT